MMINDGITDISKKIEAKIGGGITHRRTCHKEAFSSTSHCFLFPNLRPSAE
jgi:hypothetical protein